MRTTLGLLILGDNGIFEELERVVVTIIKKFYIVRPKAASNRNRKLAAFFVFKLTQSQAHF
jgi:hypothetical protein